MELKYWKPAVYFVSFEGTFWMFGNETVKDIKYIIMDFDYGLLTNYDFWVGLFFIILSIFCFKQFIKYTIKLL